MTYFDNTNINYMNQLSSSTPLSKEEEIKLFKRWKKNKKREKKAFNILVNSNLKFVVKIVHQYKGYLKNTNISFLDLVQEGNIGLIKAIMRYDPKKNCKIISYASHWIRAQIHKYLESNLHLVKRFTTNSGRRLMYKLGDIHEIVNCQDSERKDNLRNTLSKKTNVSIENIKQIEESIINTEFSISNEVYNFNNNDNEINGFNHIQLKSKTNIENDIIESDSKNKLKGIINKNKNRLNNRKKKLLKLRFKDNKPYEEIGKELSRQDKTNKYKNSNAPLSRERIRQIEKSIKRELKEKLSNNKTIQELVIT